MPVSVHLRAISNVLFNARNVLSVSDTRTFEHSCPSEGLDVLLNVAPDGGYMI